MKKNRP